MRLGIEVVERALADGSAVAFQDVRGVRREHVEKFDRWPIAGYHEVAREALEEAVVFHDLLDLVRPIELPGEEPLPVAIDPPLDPDRRDPEQREIEQV